MASKKSVPRKPGGRKSRRAAGDGSAASARKGCLVAKDKPVPTGAAKALEDALADSRRRQAEMAGLLKASRAVLECHDFEDAARTIFDSAKDLIGATAGYVGLLTADGRENEVLFLDSGGLPCSVDPSLPMPTRGLRAEACRTGKAVYENDFAGSRWTRFLPAGHAGLDNVLFAPLVLDGRVVGLLGLANKPGGFVEDDARLATALGEFAAIALKNSRTLESLESSERRFRTLTETASDAIICADISGCVILWNEAAEKIFGHSTEEALGKPLTFIMPKRYRRAHREALRRLAEGGRPKLMGKTIELAGLRKDGSEFPLELSLANWQGKDGVFFTGILRSAAERKDSAAQIAALARFPSENPNPVLRVSAGGAILYHNEAGAPLLEVWQCGEGEALSGHWHKLAVDALRSGGCRRAELEWRDRVFSLTYAPVVDSDYVNVYALDITDRKRAEEALRLAHNELEMRVEQRTRRLAETVATLEEEVRERKRLEAEVLQIGELERQRIGQDLHDSLGQMLSGVSFLSRVLHRRLAEKAVDEAEDAARIEAIAVDSIKLTRSLARGLNPLAQRPDSLMIAMKDLASNTESMFGIRCAFGCEEPVLIQDYVVATDIYRIAQEAVTNAVRHGKAKNIRLQLTSSEDQIVMTVRDDGIGLPDGVLESPGIGFRTMRYRAEMIKASLRMERSPEGGTIVCCCVPTRKVQ